MSSDNVNCKSGNLENAAITNGFCVQPVISTLSKVRQLFVTPSNDILALDKGTNPQRIVLLHDGDNDDKFDDFSILATQSGLNHGVYVHKEHIYASSASTVFRWPASLIQTAKEFYGNFSTQFVNTLIGPEVVIKSIPTGGHSTRTIVFDSNDRMYVSVGSGSNLDSSSARARIRRFEFNSTDVENGGIAFSSGEVFADGLRNEVGLTFDRFGVLWGVENGVDNLHKVFDSTSIDIHNDNPAEELNRFTESNAGRHYGYPFCWTEYELPTHGLGRGTVWAEDQFFPTYTDEVCRNTTIPPVVSMQAHSAPLGITFFDFWNEDNNSLALKLENCESTNKTGTFPVEYDGDAFIAFHGSWNRSPATGYKVVRVPLGDANYSNSDFSSLDFSIEPEDFLHHDGDSAEWPSGVRFVDVKFDQCGRLLVSADAGSAGNVFLIKHDNFSDFTDPTNNDNNDFLTTNQKIGIAALGIFLIAVALLSAMASKKNKSTGSEIIRTHSVPGTTETELKELKKKSLIELEESKEKL